VLSKEMVAAISVAFLCSIGFGALMIGYALSWLLDRPWSGRTAAADAATAIGMAVICVVAMALFGLAAGRGPLWIPSLALGIVVFRHSAQHLAARAASRAAA
jgi:hypothetical protein